MDFVPQLGVRAAAGGIEIARDPPVDQRRLAALAEQDVVRGAVAVHDPSFVCVGERLGDHHDARQQLEPLAGPRLALGELGVRQLVELLAQRLAIDLLEHAERPAHGGLAEPVDLDDRRVLQLGQDLGLGGDPALEQVGHPRR